MFVSLVSTMVRLKVACLQLNPVHGDSESSMASAELALASLSRKDGVHVLLLPEMAFSGYCFTDQADVSRVAEPSDGPTTRWCAKQAKRLGCTVLCGYPRVMANDASKKKGASQKNENENEPQMFNALAAVGPDGETITTYHKSFLYCVDKTWASEGGGFVSVNIPVGAHEEDQPGLRRTTADEPTSDTNVGAETETEKLTRRHQKRKTRHIRATLGVCMDINPKDFVAPWGDYELANATLTHGSRLLLFASAWTHNHPDDDPALVTPVDADEVRRYWLSRLAPLVGKDVHFVCANRVGAENGILFTGCSCVISLREPEVVGALGDLGEGVLVTEIDVHDDDVFFEDDEEEVFDQDSRSALKRLQC